MSVGTKGNCRKGQELFLAIFLVCKSDGLVASGSKAAGLRQFSKVLLYIITALYVTEM